MVIDFEGFSAHPPALVGILWGGEYVAVVTDPLLRPLANETGLLWTSFPRLMGRLRRRAERKGESIVAFSLHELQVTRKFAQVDLDPWYVNARAEGKRWVRSVHPQLRPTEGWSLEFFEGVLGIERPCHLRPGHATARLRHVRDQIQRRGCYRLLTPVAKAKWTKLLQYNEVDVRSTERIMENVRRTSGGSSEGSKAVA